jgi:predicted GIY-YIG superfamily endonuclease
VAELVGTIYLLHLQTPYKHARHYLGFSTHLKARLEHHRNGTGARFMQVVTEAGIPWRVARTWQGTRNDERRLKNWHNSAQLCPICLKEKHERTDAGRH